MLDRWPNLWINLTLNFFLSGYIFYSKFPFSAITQVSETASKLEYVLLEENIYRLLFTEVEVRNLTYTTNFFHLNGSREGEAQWRHWISLKNKKVS